jgi:hypothetical protein
VGDGKRERKRIGTKESWKNGGECWKWKSCVCGIGNPRVRPF